MIIWLIQGIGSMMSGKDKDIISTDAKPSLTDPCENINSRLKAAKITDGNVNDRSYQKYPDRPRKRLDPNSPSDRLFGTEWCKVAETLMSDR